jgi:hypothetical protein
MPKLALKVTLVLAVIAGVLEYLNQQAFGLPAVWYQVVKYGLFVLTTFGVTAAVGNQLGLDIQSLLHLSHAVIVLIGVVAVALGGAVSTFAIDGVAKGIILGVVAFVTACFGPSPSVGARV